MEIRFKTGKAKIKDLINSKEDRVSLVHYGYDKPVVKNWIFTNYKRTPEEVAKAENTIDKWVYLYGVEFVDCHFKDVNFIGGVPIDGCTFKNCTFENCLLTDHIRWSEFYDCKFNFCIFGGYLHGTDFKKCKFSKVLIAGYGNVVALQNKCKCDSDMELELFKYFYPVESQVFETYKIGEPYLIKTFDGYHKKYKTYKIEETIYFKDKVKRIEFTLEHYKPEIRIIGRYAPLVEECIPYNEKYKK